MNTTIELQRTDSSSPDFKKLIVLLDHDLAVRDGKDHAFYHQFNQIDHIKYVIVAYENGEAIGCGAIKEFDTTIMEVKRMFTLPASRGKGIASKLLKALEEWATEMSYEKCILETGIKQPEAVALYKKNRYSIIENYGQYAGIANSICFEKSLS